MMDEKIRVRTDSRYAELYDGLKRTLVSEFHELFFLSACIGFSSRKKRKLVKAEDRFWSGTIKPAEWTVYYSMVLKNNAMDFASIGDDKEVIKSIEEYAASGLDILVAGYLDEYLLADQLEPRLDINAAIELPKLTLGYLFQQWQNSVKND